MTQTDARPVHAAAGQGGRQRRLTVGIIVGSTRPGRKADSVARWLDTIAAARGDADYETIDLADYALPLLDESLPPMAGQYSQPHTQRWASTISRCDAFVFITPEYNHSTSGALKNAIDFLYAEWNDKAAGFVSYGVNGGTRAVEHLRTVMGELKVADVRATVSLSVFDDFQDHTLFDPKPAHEQQAHAMLDDLISWATALTNLRDGPTVG